jgi:hypothetical protein
VSAGLPLHAAWQQLLGSFLPFLMEEADYAADAFFMRKWVDGASVFHTLLCFGSPQALFAVPCVALL